MSGLIEFFKDFLPNVHNIDHSRRWEDLTDDEKAGAIIPQRNSSDPLVAALSRRSIRPLVDLFPEPLTFQEWRSFNRDSLEAFYQRRFITELEETNDQEIDDEDGPESDFEEQGEESEENEMVLDSQPTNTVPQNIQDETMPKKRKKHRWRIPPLYQAIHSIQTLGYLDLRTKDLTLDLCKVTKIWSLRETQRGSKYLKSPTGEHKQACCVFPGRMPRVVFGNLEDDGPLSPIYKYVLSLEIEQLLPKSSSSSSSLLLSSPSTTTPRRPKRAIRIFLYNAYAKAVSEWIDKHKKINRPSRNTMRNIDESNSKYILSLSKIPAVAIFPHALDPRDWWEQEHVLPYCICLGDASNMASATEEGNTTILRADSDDMEMRLAMASRSGNSSSAYELVLTKQMQLGSTQELSARLPTPSALSTRWNEYYRQAKETYIEPETVIVRPQAPQRIIVPTVAPKIPNFTTTAMQIMSHEIAPTDCSALGNPVPRYHPPPIPPAPPIMGVPPPQSNENALAVSSVPDRQVPPTQPAPLIAAAPTIPSGKKVPAASSSPESRVAPNHPARPPLPVTIVRPTPLNNEATVATSAPEMPVPPTHPSPLPATRAPPIPSHEEAPVATSAPGMPASTTHPPPLRVTTAPPIPSHEEELTARSVPERRVAPNHPPLLLATRVPPQPSNEEAPAVNERRVPPSHPPSLMAARVPPQPSNEEAPAVNERRVPPSNPSLLLAARVPPKPSNIEVLAVSSAPERRVPPSHPPPLLAAGVPPKPSNQDVLAARLAPERRVLPAHPPPIPSLPVRRPVEHMSFEGAARKRPRSSDASHTPTNLINQSHAPIYVPLASLRTLYDESQASRAGPDHYRKIDTYAVILGFTAPSQTKRGDWMVTASLVDETCTVPVTLVIFTKHYTQLPQFQRTGDVIRMHRVALQFWKEGVQLSGRKESSYVIIRRRSQANAGNSGVNRTSTHATPHASSPSSWKVVPTATHEYSFEDSDEERSQNLWYWGQKLLQEQQTIIHPQHKFTLGDMATLTEDDLGEAHDRDLIVMVIARIPFPIEEQTSITACGFLRVWDGTGQENDPFPIPSEEAFKVGQKYGDPPSSVVAKVVSIIDMIAASDKSSGDGSRPSDQTHGGGNLEVKMDHPGALCGKVANAVIWERAHWNLICKHVPIGTFIRLRNVGVRKWKEQSFRCKYRLADARESISSPCFLTSFYVFEAFMVHSKSWLSPLPNLTFEIRNLLREHDKRVKRKEYNVQSGLLPSSYPSGCETISNGPPPRSSFSISIPLGNGLFDFASRVVAPKVHQERRLSSKKSKRVSENCYKGIVQIVEPTFPEFKGNLQVYCSNDKSSTPVYRCAMTVTDESSISLQVIVLPHLAERIFGVPAIEAARGKHRRVAPFDTDAAWKVSLYSTLKEGRRYFVMTDLEQVSESNG